MTYIARAQLLVLFAFCCIFTATAQAPFPAVHMVPDVIAPVTLFRDTTPLHLADIFKRPAEIDSITFSKGVRCIWNKKMNTVSIIAHKDIKPLEEIKLWSKGFGYCVVLERDVNSGKPDPGRPMINTSRLGRGSFTIAVNYSRYPFSIACYWQNFKLGRGFVRRAGEEMLISIPEAAQKMKRSYIRVFANDNESRSNDILVPLQYGEVVHDPSEINMTYSPKAMDSIRRSQQIDADHDVCAAFYADRPTDTLVLKLKQAMDIYGSHHLLSNIRFDAHKAFSFSAGHDQVLWLQESSDDRLLMLMALVTAIPGAGVDTSSIVGYDGQDIKQKQMHDSASKLLRLRADYIALTYGETEVGARGDVLMIRRTYFSQTLLFVFNRSKAKQSVDTGFGKAEVRTVFGHPVSAGVVELPPTSFEVLIK